MGMEDLCRTCILRGNVRKCLAADCNQHESWYAKEQQKTINELVDLAIWMTGCGYDFCQHDYFIEKRELLLKQISMSADDDIDRTEEIPRW